MELRQLRYFIAVAEEESFTRAAQRCRVAQPSLSQQIINLETELGETLFHRHPRSVKLTRAGQTLLRSALAIRKEVSRTEQLFKERAELQSGEVRVGIIPTIAPYLLPKAIREFHAEYPGIQIRVKEEQTSNLVKLIAKGEIDFAIASDIESDVQKRNSLLVRSLFYEELMFAYSDSHYSAESSQEVSIADIKSEELIVMSEGHCLSDQVLSVCKAVRTSHDAIECEQLETVLSLVAMGLGVSIVPRMAQPLADLYQVRLSSFQAKEPPTRMISSVRKKQEGLNPASDKFFEFVIEACGRLC